MLSPGTLAQPEHVAPPGFAGVRSAWSEAGALGRVATLAMAFATTGCSGGDAGYVPIGAYDPATSNILVESIDTGEHLDATPGKGAGVFVEYDAGGNWHIFATCDTDTPQSGGYSCAWDLVASVDPALDLTVVDQADLEASDAVYRLDKGALRLVFQTDVDTDGVRLSAPSGKELSLDVVLDGSHDASLVSWVSKQTVQTGTSDPVDFAPTSP